jgi:hypothetical protein
LITPPPKNLGYQFYINITNNFINKTYIISIAFENYEKLKIAEQYNKLYSNTYEVNKNKMMMEWIIIENCI